MTHKPGRRDFYASTGAVSTWAVRYHRRGDNAAASAVVAGDFIMYDGLPWPVYSATVPGAGKVRLVLGAGTYSDPVLVLADTDAVATCPPETWEAGQMRVFVPETETEPWPTTVAVPTDLADDDTTLVITVDDEWLEQFQTLLDYGDDGRARTQLQLRHDIHGTFGGVPLHVLTGTLTIDRSAVSPVYADPDVVVP
jgi:hypothetical protein